MTNKNTIALFSRYNEKANEGLCKVAGTLTAEEWNREFVGFFNTVRSLCSHNFVTDFSYLMRFNNLRPFQTLEDPYFKEAYAPGTVYFENKDDFIANRPVLDKLILRFCEEVTEEDLVATLRFEGRNGMVERNFGAWMLQLFTHSAHHRGAISVYLELLGKENDYNSFAQIL